MLGKTFRELIGEAGKQSIKKKRKLKAKTMKRKKVKLKSITAKGQKLLAQKGLAR